MKIEVHLYAMLRETVGASFVLELNEEQPTSDSLIHAFKLEFPMFENIPLRVAVDHSFVSHNMALKENQHIALIPPVSGG